MQSGDHFINYRQKTTPMWVYRGLHALPAIIWSIAMPLQHIDSLRKKWPVYHRTAGYVALSMSLILSITGYWFFLSKNAYTHEDMFHAHTFKGFPISWPTFELSTYLVAPFYWFTMYKTALTARARQFVQHRKWAVLHTICACIISVERLGVILIYTGGWVMSSKWPKQRIHEYFGVGYTMDDIAEAELSAFAFGNVFAYAGVFLWTAYEFGRAGYFGGVKNFLLSTNTAKLSSKKVQ